MGKYIILGNKVFYEHFQEQGVLSLEEFSSQEFFKEEKAYVLLMDVKFECLSKEEQKKNLLDNRFVQQEEILQQGLFQRVSVSQENLENIFKYFKRGSVEKCLPYVLSVRATLMKENIFDELKIIIVFEQLNDVVLVSIFEGAVVLNSRFFVDMTIDDVLMEVMRGLKRSGVLENKEVIVVMNNERMKEEIKEKKLFDQEKIVLLERKSIGFLYLEDVRFRINFLLPKEEERLKDEKRKKVLYRQIMRWLVFLFISIGMIGSGVYMKKKLNFIKEGYIQQSELLKKEEDQRQRNVFLKTLRNRKKIFLRVVLKDLMKGMPYGWKLQKVIFYQTDIKTMKVEAKMLTSGYGAYVCHQKKQHCYKNIEMKQGQMIQTLKFDWLDKGV